MRQAVTGQENQSDFSKIQRIHTAVGQQYRLNSRALLQENGEVMFICPYVGGVHVGISHALPAAESMRLWLCINKCPLYYSSGQNDNHKNGLAENIAAE